MRTKNLLFVASALAGLLSNLDRPVTAQRQLPARTKAVIASGKARPEQTGNRQRLAEKAQRRRERQAR
jgi:hypothetical protein